jgi:hypothetical protein
MSIYFISLCLSDILTHRARQNAILIILCLYILTFAPKLICLQQTKTEGKSMANNKEICERFGASSSATHEA